MCRRISFWTLLCCDQEWEWGSGCKCQSVLSTFAFVLHIQIVFPCGLVVCLLGFLCIFFVSCVFVDRVVCFLLFVFWFDFLSLLFLYLILSLPFRVHVLLLFRFCLIAFYYRHGLPARRKMEKSKKNKP